MFIARRYSLIIIALHLNHLSSLQVVLVVLTNLFFLIYSIKTDPFVDREARFNDMLSEWCVMCLSYHLFLFTDFGPGLEEQYFLGWSYIFFIAAMLSNNFWKIGRTLVADTA